MESAHLGLRRQDEAVERRGKLQLLFLTNSSLRFLLPVDLIVFS